jgi:hypothetical protein
MSLLKNNQVYRGAVALNNIGVDLLERKYYEQALVTLADATSAMKTALRSLHGTPPPPPPPQDNINVMEMVERANKRRSRPSRLERQRFNGMLNDDTSQQDEYDDFFLLETIHPIRINDVSPDTLCPGNLRDPEVQGAVVVYNYALANLFLARGAHQQHVREMKLNHASFLFELANSILEQRISGMEHELEQRIAGMEDELTIRRLASMNAAVLSGLLRTVSSESVVTERIKVVYARLHTMRSVIDDLDDYLYQYTCGIQAAAAA